MPGGPVTYPWFGFHPATPGPQQPSLFSRLTACSLWTLLCLPPSLLCSAGESHGSPRVPARQWWVPRGWWQSCLVPLAHPQCQVAGPSPLLKDRISVRSLVIGSSSCFSVPSPSLESELPPSIFLSSNQAPAGATQSVRHVLMTLNYRGKGSEFSSLFLWLQINKMLMGRMTSYYFPVWL